MRPSAGTSSCETLHVAINSLATFTQPRARLLAELAGAGVPLSQVHVFLGDSGADADERPWRAGEEGGSSASSGGGGAWHYRVRHNSVDFTAMVHIVENPQHFRAVRQWFYMHDTTSVGRHFWRNLTAWCSGLPACALPLTRFQPTSSMGLYDAAFLRARSDDVLELKNKRGAPALRWKVRGLGWEDKLFKVCDAQSEDRPVRRFTRQCYNATLKRRTCLCSKVDIAKQPERVYGEGSQPRQVWRYPCMDVSKFKANWARNRTMTLAV